MTLVWYVAAIKTGDVLDELPLAVPDLSKTLSTKTTCSATLNIHDKACPPSWAELLDGTRSMLVAVNDDVPLGGWIIDTADIGDPSVPFGLASLEACAEYVYCRDHVFTDGQDDEADALAALFADDLVPGWGFGLQVEKTGRTVDHETSWWEDRTVAAVAAEWASAEGGPEWTTRVAWSDATQSRFVKTIEIGPRVGSVVSGVVFEDHHLSRRLRKRSWRSRATHVIATGDGAGQSRPMSAVHVDQAALDAGVPPWQARVPAPTSSTDADLDRVAGAELVRRRYGVSLWEATIAATENGAPRVGVDWNAGDTVTVDLSPTVNDPRSWAGSARVIGWKASTSERTITQVTPVFWDPDEELS